jgi:hypothetical protein
MGVGDRRLASDTLSGKDPSRNVMEAGPQGMVGRVRKFSSPLGFEPRTVQPISSRYTNYTIPAQFYFEKLLCSCIKLFELPSDVFVLL